MDTRTHVLALLIGALGSALIVGTFSRFALVLFRHFIDRATAYNRLKFWLNFLGKVSGFEWCYNCNSFHPDEKTGKEIHREMLSGGPHRDECFAAPPGEKGDDQLLHQHIGVQACPHIHQAVRHVRLCEVCGDILQVVEPGDGGAAPESRI